MNTIKFNENTSISVFNYRTYMNNLAIFPYICLHALQIQNVKKSNEKQYLILKRKPKNRKLLYKKIL